MKKLVLPLIFTCAVALSAQENPDLRILIDAPANVVAGNSFDVRIVFHKGTLNDYSRFSQELPSGFTATNISSPNADFTYDEAEKRIRIIWLKLPEGDSVAVEYTVSVDPRIQGTLMLGGSFAYIREGAREFINVDAPVTVNVLPNPELDPSDIVAIEDFEKMLAESAGGAEASGPFALVVRQSPLVHPNGMVYVTLLVKKPEGTRFLKIEEVLPGGYTFEALDAHGAVVSQAASVAKFIWMQPPGDEMFTVQYRLVPILEKEQAPMVIEGNLTFTEGEESRVVAVKEKNADLLAMNHSQQSDLLETGTVPEELRKADASMIRTGQGTGTKASTSLSKTERGQTRPSGGEGVNPIPDLEAQQGIYFRVQIAALRTPDHTNNTFSGYPLLSNAMVERSGGWHKYTVGSYSTYEQAASARDRINRTTPVNGAFVVAYRNGNRIDIFEALK